MAKIKTYAGTREHAVVSHDAWMNARKEFLAKEKEFTRLRDQLNEQRRQLPWEKVEKSYVFEGPSGKVTLADLFAGKSQLLVWHFMFGPEWKQGCSHCSMWADTFNANAVHMRARDITMIAISRAPWSKIEPFRKRMGWTFKWVSSANTDFNFDYQASARPEELQGGKVLYNYQMMEPFSDQMHGCSAFYKDDDGAIYHTYSTYARGVDMLNGAYHYIDLTAKGRDEDPAAEHPSGWVRHHDRYEQ